MDPEYSEGHALSPFSYCKLFTLTLPKTFKYIDSVALQVQSLGAIKCMGDEPPAATSDIGIYDIVRLYVTEGAKSKYMEAKYWSNFKDCIEFSQDNSVIENPLKWIVLEDFKDYPFIICDINNSAMMSENIYYGQGYGGNLVVPETITYEDKIYDVKKNA